MTLPDPDARAALVRESFLRQSMSCARLGSPFMGRLMELCSTRLAPGTAVADRLLGWPGNPAIDADNVSLRLGGALHALAIEGAAPALVAVYPPHEVDDEALWAAVEQTLTTHEAFLLPWLDQPPQTNEVRRAAALIPAFHLVAAATGLPLGLWEIGCSGGLNLRADRFALEAGATRYGPTDSPLRLAPEWEGSAPAPADLRVAERRGVDLSPLDPADPAHRLRLRSYLWPDQPHRRALTDAALTIAREVPAEVTRADAVDWLEAHLPRRPLGVTTVLFHTVAWQYLPDAARQRGDALIAEAGATATNDAPLARIGMEADGGRHAGLTLTIWPGGATHALGRADFHGRRMEWTGPTVL